MATYTHTLSEIDIACGVTLEDVARELPRGVFRGHGSVFVVARELSPALASSVARAAFAGQPVDYAGMTNIGRAYQVASA
jgi:hypothetical protein